jgi:hypothetical protein
MRQGRDRLRPLEAQGAQLRASRDLSGAVRERAQVPLRAAEAVVTGLERVVVGYRKGDRRIYRLEHEHGQIAVRVGKCASCGWPTHFVKSGQDAYMQRDPEILCEECYKRYERDIVAEL